jgi:hypothetical protein
MNKKNTPYFIFITGIVLTAIFLACRKIGQPGLYYDEMLFANAALGGKTNDFIFLKLFGIPFLLMEYIGAIKAWIYYPIFSIFPINYWSIRLPSILIGVMGGIALVASLWRGFDKNTAIAGAIMILVDPTLLMHSRLDWGPNALMFFFRGAIMFAIASFMKTRNIKWAWISIGAGFLGVYDKLNFVWFTCAISGALLIVYYQPLKKAISSDPRKYKILFIAVVLVIALSIWRAANVAQHSEISWPNRLVQAFGLIRYTLPGGGVLNFISGNGFRNEHLFWPGYIIVFIVALFGILPLYKQKKEWNLFLFSVITLILCTGAFIATKSATGPHHASILCGFWQFALAPLIGMAWNNKENRFKILTRVLIGVGLIVIFAGSFITNITCVDAFAAPINNNWDTSNTIAALFAKQHPDAYFITTDWGVGTQLIAVTKGNSDILDAWPTFTKSEEATNFIQNMKRDKDTYIYTRLPGFENFKGNRANLFEALHKYDISYQIIQTYNNVFGQPMIQILLVPSVSK